MEEKVCSSADIEKIKLQLTRSKTSLKVAAGIGIILSLLLPFLPPKYKGGKSMLDLMSYPEAVLGILAVFGIVFACAYYTLVYRLKQDVKEGKKILLSTRVVDKRKGKYRPGAYYYFTATGLPFLLRNIPLTAEQYNSLNAGDSVVIEYSKKTKTFLGFQRF